MTCIEFSGDLVSGVETGESVEELEEDSTSRLAIFDAMELEPLVLASFRRTFRLRRFKKYGDCWFSAIFVSKKE